VKTAEVMTRIILHERRAPNAFATILVGTIDVEKHSLSWLNAGHLPPLLVSDQVVSLDSRPLPPLGVSPDINRSLHRFRLPQSWSLFCYTDGLIDVRLGPGSPQRFGEDRLKERLRSWIDVPPGEEALDELLEEIETGSGGRFADDVAVLLIATKDLSPQAGSA
jgi:serine phosphatase RsbU (regulator of sigma subunit)